MRNTATEPPSLFADGSTPHSYKLARSRVLHGRHDRRAARAGDIKIGGTATDSPGDRERARQERLKREGLRFALPQVYAGSSHISHLPPLRNRVRIPKVAALYIRRVQADPVVRNQGESGQWNVWGRNSPRGSLDTLWTVGALGAMTDGELLDHFHVHRDTSGQDAFRILVQRHGPMVLGLCRSLLRDPHDAEDAFQATFLVLVRGLTRSAIGRRSVPGSVA